MQNNYQAPQNRPSEKRKQTGWKSWHTIISIIAAFFVIILFLATFGTLSMIKNTTTLSDQFPIDAKSSLVHILTPATQSTFSTGQTISITSQVLNGSDLQSVVLWVNDTISGTYPVTSPSEGVIDVQYNWTPNSIGNYVIIVRAIDTSGSSSDSNPVFVEIKDPITINIEEVPAQSTQSLVEIAIENEIPLGVAQIENHDITDPLSPLPEGHSVKLPLIQPNEQPVPEDITLPAPVNNSTTSQTSSPSNLQNVLFSFPTADSKIPPQAPLLGVINKDCSITLIVTDQSDNEAGFFVYRLKNQPGNTYERIATLAPLKGDAVSFQDNIFGSYTYMVTAFNQAGESGSSLVNVKLDDFACASRDLFSLNVEKPIFTVNQPVQKTYCYVSRDHSSWIRVPSNPDDFFLETPDDPITPDTENNPEDSSMTFDLQDVINLGNGIPNQPFTLSFNCFGWNGNLVDLGLGETIIDPQNSLNQEFFIQGEQWTLQGKINPSIEAPTNQIGGIQTPITSVQITSPTNLRQATYDECVNGVFPKRKGVLGKVFNALFNQQKYREKMCTNVMRSNDYFIIAWDWNPDSCLAGDHVCPYWNDIDGFNLYWEDHGKFNTYPINSSAQRVAIIPAIYTSNNASSFLFPSSKIMAKADPSPLNADSYACFTATAKLNELHAAEHGVEESSTSQEFCAVAINPNSPKRTMVSTTIDLHPDITATYEYDTYLRGIDMQDFADALLKGLPGSTCPHDMAPCSGYSSGYELDRLVVGQYQSDFGGRKWHGVIVYDLSGIDPETFQSATLVLDIEQSYFTSESVAMGDGFDIACARSLVYDARGESGWETKKITDMEIFDITWGEHSIDVTDAVSNALNSNYDRINFDLRAGSYVDQGSEFRPRRKSKVGCLSDYGLPVLSLNVNTLQ